MACFLYVLYSVGYDRSYVGISENAARRLREHNQGRIKSTKAYLPWKIVYLEEHLSKHQARQREKYLKSAAGRRWRHRNIKLEKGD